MGNKDALPNDGRKEKRFRSQQANLHYKASRRRIRVHDFPNDREESLNGAKEALEWVPRVATLDQQLPASV